MYIMVVVITFIITTSQFFFLILLLLCLYSFRGNYRGQHPYIEGDWCSSCASPGTCKGKLCSKYQQNVTFISSKRRLKNVLNYAELSIEFVAWGINENLPPKLHTVACNKVFFFLQFNLHSLSIQLNWNDLVYSWFLQSSPQKKNK